MDVTPITREDPPQALLGVGHVWHQRLRPARHAFRHRSYFVLLPMRAGRAHGWPIPRKKWGLMSFRDQDHGHQESDALHWIEQLLQHEGIDDADGEIWLLTYPRVLGHTFKPVSFWIAERRDGTLAAVVAEVNNTFGERHCYLLTGPDLAWGHPIQASKVFHVSPFNSVAGHYTFCFTRTPQRIHARIDLHDAGGPLVQTSIGGELQPYTRAAAWRTSLTHPLMTLGVVVRIHWHALQLLFKRVPFFHKPDAPERFITR